MFSFIAFWHWLLNTLVAEEEIIEEMWVVNCCRGNQLFIITNLIHLHPQIPTTAGSSTSRWCGWMRWQTLCGASTMPRNEANGRCWSGPAPRWWWSSSPSWWSMVSGWLKASRPHPLSEALRAFLFLLYTFCWLYTSHSFHWFFPHSGFFSGPPRHLLCLPYIITPSVLPFVFPRITC